MLRLKKPILSVFIITICLCAASMQADVDDHTTAAHHGVHDDDDTHPAEPEIAVIGNFLTELTDNRENPNRGKFRAKEAELALQMFLLPGLRANIWGTIEQEYESNHVINEFDLEEANITFMDFPHDMQVIVGRKLIEFGKLNPIHPHWQPFADSPLVLQNFLGEHNWYDDGIFIQAPHLDLWNIPLTVGLGYYKGRNDSHEHGGGYGHDHDEDGPIEWKGNVYLARIAADIELDEQSEIEAGYSLAFDNGHDTNLHGLDLTYVRHLPGEHRKLTWQNELLFADVKESDTESTGFYSMVNLSLDKHWDIGGRYDWSQSPADDRDHEWAVSPFVTYHFNEWMYGRVQYRYREMMENHEPENAIFLQLVVELGAHSHNGH